MDFGLGTKVFEGMGLGIGVWGFRLRLWLSGEYSLRRFLKNPYVAQTLNGPNPKSRGVLYFWGVEILVN